jgi:threonine/homoserine/homoserine lactone efflux protein
VVAVDELVFGLALGFSLTIPPGPMNALIASQSVRSATTGFVTGLGAMTADLVLGGVVFGLRSTVDLDEYLRAIYLLGAVAMAYFAYRIWTRRDVSSAPEEGRVRTYSQAVALGLSNPVQIVWWLTAGLAFAYLGGLVLFVGIFVAILVWVVTFPTLIHRGSRRYPEMGRWVAIVSSAIMVAFAVYFVVLAAGAG